MAFKFPSEIEFDGMQWRLVYAPDCETTVTPNLEGGQITDFKSVPVTVAGRSAPIYMTMVDVVFPAKESEKGEVVGERRMKGFRTYAQPPLNIGAIQPKDCVFYIAVLPQRHSSEAQRFFDAVFGQTSAQVEAQVEGKPDTSWCEALAELKKSEVKHEPASRQDAEERSISD